MKREYLKAKRFVRKHKKTINTYIPPIITTISASIVVGNYLRKRFSSTQYLVLTPNEIEILKNIPGVAGIYKTAAGDFRVTHIRKQTPVSK